MDKRNENRVNEAGSPMDADTTNAGAKISSFFHSSKDALLKYSQCTICGSHLHFTHVTDFSRNLTQETARCPECGVRARQVTHRLQ